MEPLSLEAQEGQRSELLPLADGQSEPALAQLALELGRTARLAAWRELEWMECWNVIHSRGGHGRFSQKDMADA